MEPQQLNTTGGVLLRGLLSFEVHLIVTMAFIYVMVVSLMGQIPHLGLVRDEWHSTYAHAHNEHYVMTAAPENKVGNV